MVDAGQVELGLEGPPAAGPREVVVVEPKGVAAVLGRVHTGAGEESVVGQALLVAELEERSGPIADTDDHVGHATGVGRSDDVAVPVFVAVETPGFGIGAQVETLGAPRRLDRRGGSVRPRSHAPGGVDSPGGLLGGGRRQPLVENGAGAAAGPVEQRLHALDHGYAVESGGRGERGGRVHPVRAAAVDVGAVDEDVQVRLAESANPGLESVPSHAAEGDSTEPPQEVRTVADGHRRQVLAPANLDGRDRLPVVDDVEHVIDDQRLGIRGDGLFRRWLRARA